MQELVLCGYLESVYRKDCVGVCCVMFGVGVFERVEIWILCWI